MKIKISGSRCITCRKYTQYYQKTLMDENLYEAIDCGYCGQNSRNTRPGNRCKKYKEAGDVKWVMKPVLKKN